VLNFDSGVTEVNLQVYEQAQGAIVGGVYSQMFTSPIAGNAATSTTFGNGGAIWPVVADLNEDGLWDLVVCWEKGTEGTQGTTGTQGTEATEGTFARIAQPQLPTYRDFPGGGQGLPALPEYAYKVSSVSRFYTAGNSTPTETESMPTEPVTAKLGGVKFFWNDAVAKVGEQVAVKRAISGAEKAMARSRKRAEKGLCSKEESEAFCARSESALKSYLDRQVKEGAITPAERKALGR